MKRKKLKNSEINDSKKVMKIQWKYFFEVRINFQESFY